MRVQSTRQKALADGSVGYLHPINGFKFQPPQERAPHPRHHPVDIPKCMLAYRNRITDAGIQWLASNLGVSVGSLNSLCVGRRDTYTYAFPMRNSSNDIIGIRLRSTNGKKFAERGSHNGLFIPQNITCSDGTVFLPEGPTNTAAALTLGLFAVGRPNTSAGATDILDYIKRNKFRRAVIFADTDDDKERTDGSHFNPGFDSAERLLGMMEVTACVLPLVTKDVRSFVQQGGTAAMVWDSLKSTLWRKP